MEKPKSEPHLAPASAKVSKVDFKTAAPEKGKLMKKKNTAAGDPTREAKPARKHVMAERSGARYGIRVGFSKQVAPEAGATQSNGRILPAAVNRSQPNFTAGMAE